MKIRKLNPEIIRKPEIFEYYIGNYDDVENIFLDEYYDVELSPENLFFPIYVPPAKKEQYFQALTTMRDNYLKLGRDILLDANFWYSLFLNKLKDQLKKEYPSTLESEKDFRNIILKPFNWENYVYKFIFGAEYIQEMIPDVEEQNKYFNLLADNVDVYNYILKSKIFKNSEFLIKFLKTILKTNSSDILKKKIDLSNGKDERMGRKIIYEFAKNYPTVFVHALDENEFEDYFKKCLNYYSELAK
jgi:hypothetical protein